MGDVRDKRSAETVEEAVARIEEIRRVYESGFLTRGEFESIKRSLERRIERTRSRRAA